MEVRIPTPLRSYTDQRSVVAADGDTIDELLRDIDRQYPGIRFRMVDEQDRLRRHMKVFLDQDSVRDLETPLGDTTVVTIMQALSGG